MKQQHFAKSILDPHTIKANVKLGCGQSAVDYMEPSQIQFMKSLVRLEKKSKHNDGQ